MEAVLEKAEVLDSVRATWNTQVARWIAECRRFRAWERETMLLQEPSAQMRACHKRSLEFLLKLTQSLLREGEMTDEKVFGDLREAHDRLSDSWAHFYDRIPEEEAKQILAKVFPE